MATASSHIADEEILWSSRHRATSSDPVRMAVETARKV